MYSTIKEAESALGLAYTPNTRCHVRLLEESPRVLVDALLMSVSIIERSRNENRKLNSIIEEIKKQTNKA